MIMIRTVLISTLLFAAPPALSQEPGKDHSKLNTGTERSDTMGSDRKSSDTKGDISGEYIEKQPNQTWLAINFFGAPVKNADGEEIGDINNLLVDSDGRVRAVIVGTGGVLGVGEKDIAVPFSKLAVSQSKSGAREFVLNAPRSELKRAPAFTQTETTTADQARQMLKRAGETIAAAVEEMQKSAGELTDSARDSIEGMTDEEDQRRNSSEDQKSQ